MSETKNLGLVAAIKIGPTPPTNTGMLWYDNNPGQLIHKAWSIEQGRWIPLTGASGSINPGGTTLQYLRGDGSLGALLDSNGKILTTLLPALAISQPFIVNSEVEMLALVAQTGDVAIRTDIQRTFILGQEPSSVLANWIELLTSSGVDYTETVGIPQTFGGLPAGFVPSGDIRLTMRAMLYPYQQPGFTAFNLNVGGVYEVGQNVSAGPFVFTWVTTNEVNVVPNSLEIRDLGNGNPLGVGLANDGTETFAYGPLTRNTVGDRSFRIQGTNTQTQLFQRTIPISWRTRRLRGIFPISLRPQIEAAVSIENILFLLQGTPGAGLSINDLNYTRATGSNLFNLGAFAPTGGHIFWLWDTALGDASFLQGAIEFPVDKLTRNLENQYNVTTNYRLFISSVATSGTAISVNVQ